MPVFAAIKSCGGSDKGWEVRRMPHWFNHFAELENSSLCDDLSRWNGKAHRASSSTVVAAARELLPILACMLGDTRQAKHCLRHGTRQ